MNKQPILLSWCNSNTVNFIETRIKLSWKLWLPVRALNSFCQPRVLNCWPKGWRLLFREIYTLVSHSIKPVGSLCISSVDFEGLLVCVFFPQTRIRSSAAAVYSVAATMIKDGTYVWRRSAIKPTEEKEVTIIMLLITLYLHLPLWLPTRDEPQLYFRTEESNKS